mgnify:CR=1 FL=1
MDKVALLVGNSDGIGLAMTRRLLERGWTVHGISRSPSPVNHASCTHLVMSVSDPAYPAEVNRIAATTRPSLCIYCAGIGLKLDVGNIDRELSVFDVNLMGMIRTFAAVVPGMIQRNGGHFIGISSLADELNDHGHPSYSASKAGFTRYLESIAPAMRRRGVAVTNVRFGFVRTKMPEGDRLPFIMTVERAADHLERCMSRRPVRYSTPKIMVPMVKLARVVLFFRHLFG